MSRNRKISSKTKNINRSHRIRKSQLYCRRTINTFSNSSSSKKEFTCFNYTVELQKLLKFVLSSDGNKFIFGKPRPNYMLMTKRNRIGASLISRILSWKKTGLSLFKQHYKAFSQKTIPNDFENEVEDILRDIVYQIIEKIDEYLILFTGQLFSNLFYPYLIGTPDFVIVSQNQDPLFVIECKHLNSQKEFQRHVRLSTEGVFELKNSSEYKKQLQAYLNILLVPSGLLLIKFGSVTYIFNVKLERFTSKQVFCLSEFYIGYLIPFVLLNRFPTKTNNIYQFFSSVELNAMKKALPTYDNVQSLYQFDFISNFTRPQREYE